MFYILVVLCQNFCGALTTDQIKQGISFRYLFLLNHNSNTFKQIPKAKVIALFCKEIRANSKKKKKSPNNKNVSRSTYTVIYFSVNQTRVITRIYREENHKVIAF